MTIMENEALHILFLDKSDFPIREIEAGVSDFPIAVPPNARSARIELQTDGITLVRVTDPKLSGQTVEAIPQNSVGVYDGDVFSSYPRYMFLWEEDGGGPLTFGLYIERLTYEQAAFSMFAAMSAIRTEIADARLETERLRGAFTDIFESHAWRIVRVYYAFKDGLKTLVKGLPLVGKLIYQAAALLGIRSRAKPILPKSGRLAEAEALFRRSERKIYPLAELPARPVTDLRVAVHLHLFYVDMAGFFAQWLSHIPLKVDLFLSVPDGTKDSVAAPFAALESVGSVTVEAVENRGRDVRPMIRAFGDKLAGYDVFLHIHSKRSPHDGALAGWLDHLLKNLLGDGQHTAKILGLYADHPDLGLLYPEPLNAFPYWTLTNSSNKADMARLFAQLGADFPADETYPDFPVGTMFWARGQALSTLLRTKVEGFQDESGQVDGTLAHAIERSFGLIARQAGYRPAQIDVTKGIVNLGPGLKNLPEYISMTWEDAAQYLRGFKGAAFDLFGTLAVSDFRSDKALWAKVAEMSFEGFPQSRKEAEAAAKEHHGAPDIHNVYAEFRRVTGLSPAECQRLKALEFELLLNSCRPRQAVVRLLDHLLDREVVIAEDTLWPKAYVQAILDQCGVRRDIYLYLSGDIGYYKRNGSLYDYLKGRFKGQGFVNVGDDDFADAHIPNTRRIHSLHVMNPDDMAAVIGLTESEASLYRDRMVADPFCLLDVMRERAKLQ